MVALKEMLPDAQVNAELGRTLAPTVLSKDNLTVTVSPTSRRVGIHLPPLVEDSPKSCVAN